MIVCAVPRFSKSAFHVLSTSTTKLGRRVCIKPKQSQCKSRFIYRHKTGILQSYVTDTREREYQKVQVMTCFYTLKMFYFARECAFRTGTIEIPIMHCSPILHSCAFVTQGMRVSAPRGLCARLRFERSGFEPWAGTLC